jgi:hypothetical protein
MVIANFFGSNVVMAYTQGNQPNFSIRLNNGKEAKVSFGKGYLIVEGDCSGKDKAAIEEWAARRRIGLGGAWTSLRNGQRPNPIP